MNDSQGGGLGRQERERRLGQRGCVLWLTGLSGAGKSTLATALEQSLKAAGRATYLLDGDVLRRGLCSDLGFGDEDRRENVRRVGEVAALFADAGLITICALISPFRTERAAARSAAGDCPFVEIFVDAPLSACEARDPKGLYGKARRGEIPDFTGIGSAYEPPEAPDLRIDTERLGIAESLRMIGRRLDEMGILPPC